MALLAATSGDVTKAGKAIGLALGVGLGALGAGVGIGNIFGSMIQSVARQPELRGELRVSSGSASPSPKRWCSTGSSAVDPRVRPGLMLVAVEPG